MDDCSSSSRLLWQTLFWMALAVSVSSTEAASIISTSDARLPMSLSTVVSDMEAEDCNELTTACLITSHSVTHRERNSLLSKLLHNDDQASETDVGSSKAIATDANLALAQPSTVQEVASTTCACGGTILYYPAATDLARGEGLFDSLAPAMETILSDKQKSLSKTCLVVIVAEENTSSAAETQSRLEQAAESVLGSLIADQPVSLLSDVFDQVLYVSSAQALEVVTQLGNSRTPADAASAVATAVANDLSLLFPTPTTRLSAADLAAARKLGPAARTLRRQALDRVKEVCYDDEDQPKLVTEFGSLCDAVIDQALDELDEAGESASLGHSSVGKQIRANLLSELVGELGDLWLDQVKLLQLAYFEAFQKELSQLRVNVNLASDMDRVAQTSKAAFGKAAKKLVAKKSNWNLGPAKQSFANQCNEYKQNRLLAARASGQYKPLPRKGVTVGLHWLLPKPFGNDYRQEPWMVQATDGMVYIAPEKKVTEVSPEQVAAGDWRDQIVPSPAGNDMLYMQ